MEAREFPEDQDLADDLPALAPGAVFRFACGPGAPCFNRCCAQVSLPLAPYDVLRLSPALGVSSAAFLRKFAGRRPEPQTGFHLFHLRMSESESAPCPFVAPSGCAVYADRPAACRSYPLGRGARITREGISERFFMIREEHCRGFDSGLEHTGQSWLASQNLGRHNYFNDRYMRLMSLVAATGEPLSARQADMALLCLWQIDRFREFIQQAGLLARLDMAPGRAELCLAPGLDGWEACLDLGISWLELAIFGQAPDLAHNSRPAAANPAR